MGQHEMKTLLSLSDGFPLFQTLLSWFSCCAVGGAASYSPHDLFIQATLNKDMKKTKHFSVLLQVRGADLPAAVLQRCPQLHDGHLAPVALPAQLQVEYTLTHSHSHTLFFCSMR